MIIVDTTVWVDYFRGTRSAQVDWLESRLTKERFGLTDLILCEALQGVTTNSMFRMVQEELLRLEIFETGTVELAIEAAANYRRLRVAGWTVRRTIDCLIATFCLAEGYALLHNDRDYDAFEEVLGLNVVHP
ncbi:PIN domain nuclease [Nitrospira moscoviensis]|uniref:Ribonuclease VapC n=1 Tax=Nitrospira moscoviensis TaxID=42253 RepID=A0A0K2GGQ0_NITMO|nr:PIN domain nuclease [Nitrospira moscoviensis]ALA60116.1 PilT protein domain protein [Nitrospira moscoviensis]